MTENDVGDAPLRVELTADPAAAVEEGGQITLTAAANRAVLAGEDATVRPTVVGPVVDPPSSLAIAVVAPTASAVLTVVDDEEVKDLGSVTVVATGSSLATDPTRIDVAVTEDDVETVYTYTFTASAARVTEGGGAVTLAVTATPQVEAETVVGLTVSPVSLAADYTIEPASITIAAGTTSGTAELLATDDADDGGPLDADGHRPRQGAHRHGGDRARRQRHADGGGEAAGGRGPAGPGDPGADAVHGASVGTRRGGREAPAGVPARRRRADAGPAASRPRRPAAGPRPPRSRLPACRRPAGRCRSVPPRSPLAAGAPRPRRVGRRPEKGGANAFPPLRTVQRACYALATVPGSLAARSGSHVL